MKWQHIETLQNIIIWGIRSIFECSPQQCSPWTYPWVEFGSSVDAQSHQRMLKIYKNHNDPYWSNSGLCTSQAEPLVFSSIGILWGFCYWNAAGRSVRARRVDIKTLMNLNIAYEGHAGKSKAIGDHPACIDAVEWGVLRREKHEVVYATGSHAVVRWGQKN